MPETILAIFDTPAEATAASAELRREGLPPAAITIMSGEPVHTDGDETEGRDVSRIGLYAVAGGLIGAASALLLTILPSRRVNLVTGGMPIVSLWAFGVIIFEMAALGAILFTLGRTIYEARLARRGALAHYDEAVSDNKIVLAVECADEPACNITEKVLGDRIVRRGERASTTF